MQDAAGAGRGVLSLPGLLRACSTSSRSDFTGRAGPATRTDTELATGVSGAKSRTGSNGGLAAVTPVRMKETVVNSSV